jgi:hypothetical protein
MACSNSGCSETSRVKLLLSERGQTSDLGVLGKLVLNGRGLVGEVNFQVLRHRKIA